MSSLVQVCTDSFYRTITGFSALIEKEWIALGHPFGFNMFGCTLLSNIPVRILIYRAFIIHAFRCNIVLSSSSVYVSVCTSQKRFPSTHIKQFVTYCSIRDRKLVQQLFSYFSTAWHNLYVSIHFLSNIPITY